MRAPLLYLGGKTLEEGEGGKGERDEEDKRQCDAMVLPWTLLLHELPKVQAALQACPLSPTDFCRRLTGETEPLGGDRMNSHVTWSRFTPMDATPCPPGCLQAPQKPFREQGPMPVAVAFIVPKFWSGEPGSVAGRLRTLA